MLRSLACILRTAETALSARLNRLLIALCGISCISGASRGGLSSYACNVLVIHYLQNTEPPVIPVLQQLGQQEPKLVDGCNVYFFNNIDELESVWSGKRHNLQQVGELWVGLLRYYADFDIKKYVVSIRAKTPVTRLQKRWESEFMAIEDPFDIERDLGQHVTKNKGEFIISALKKGMMRCEKPIPQPAGQYVTLVAYFFDAKTFEEGSPPQVSSEPVEGFTVKHATQPPRRSIS
ncbi:hypothetical protein MRX96_020066 [Rhipicephalus microplus]